MSPILNKNETLPMYGPQEVVKVVAHEMMARPFERVIEKIRLGLLRYSPELPDPSLVENFLRYDTAGRCVDDSYSALLRLTKKHPDMFDRRYLIWVAVSDNEPFVDDSWGSHAFFLLRDRSNKTWYAGSPSNHDIRTPNGKTMLTDLSIGELPDVLNNVYEACGGQSFPDSLNRFLSQRSAYTNQPLANIPEYQRFVIMIPRSNNGFTIEQHDETIETAVTIYRSLLFIERS